MPNYLNIHENLRKRISDLKIAICERTSRMSVTEAKIYYEHLISTYEKLVAYEDKIEATANALELYHWFPETRKVHKQVIDIKISLQNIISSAESTVPAKNTADNQSIKTAEPSETEQKFDFYTRKQIFLIRRIESLEIPDDICAVKAEVMYSHLSQLYDSFISNQIQIEASIDDDDAAALENQQKIAKKIRRKVIDFQTKLKKIVRQNESKSSTESKISIDHSSQTTQIGAEANLDSLIKKGESLFRRISLLEPEGDVSPEKAEIMYNHLNSLYDSFNSNQTEIESLVSGTALDSHLAIFNHVQNKIPFAQSDRDETGITLDKLDKISEINEHLQQCHKS